MTEDSKKFVTVFTSALSNCSLYSAEHEAVEELSRKTLSVVDQMVGETGSLEIMVVENDLIVNKTPLRDAGIHGANLVRRLKKKGISRIDFLKGIVFSELKQFISDIAEPDGQARPLPHIRIGTIDVRLSGLTIDIEIDADGLFRIASLQVERTKNIYRSISSHGQFNAAAVEEIVGTFIEAFRKKANILRLLSPVPSPGEHAYTHAVNVAVLSMFQAETLGAKDELLYDIGIAALLHDVGKLFVAREIREKEGTLSEQEWEEIRRHTVYGARYLARAEGLTRIAPLVALEHHRRYDGQGYPRLAGKERRQHLFTQIVAIADFLDSMRNRRHYGKEEGIAGMVSFMEQGAGREFNPFLANHFSKIIALSLKEKGEAKK
jgi:HD superfamily phosphohydrolase YqeK